MQSLDKQDVGGSKRDLLAAVGKALSGLEVVTGDPNALATYEAFDVRPQEAKVDRVDALEIELARRVSRRSVAIDVVVVERKVNGHDAVYLELHLEPADERRLARGRRTRDGDEALLSLRDGVGDVHDVLLVEALRHAHELVDAAVHTRFVEVTDARDAHCLEPRLERVRHVASRHRGFERGRHDRSHRRHRLPTRKRRSEVDEEAAARAADCDAACRGLRQHRPEREGVRSSARDEHDGLGTIRSKQRRRVVPALLDEARASFFDGPELLTHGLCARHEPVERRLNRRDVGGREFARGNNELTLGKARSGDKTDVGHGTSSGFEHEEHGASPKDAPALPARDRQRFDESVRVERSFKGHGTTVDGGGDYQCAIDCAWKQCPDERSRADVHPPPANGHVDDAAARQRSLASEKAHVVTKRSHRGGNVGGERLHEVQRGLWMVVAESQKARPRKAREAHGGVGLNAGGSRSMAENRRLSEVVAGAEPRDVDGAAADMTLSFEHEIHVVALVSLPNDHRVRGEGHLIEELEERPEILWTEMRKEAVLRQQGNVLGTVSVGSEGEGGRLRLARLHTLGSAWRMPGECPRAIAHELRRGADAAFGNRVAARLEPSDKRRMKLFYTPTSPFVRKVMVAAHEIGLAEQIETTMLRPSPLEPSAVLSRENPLSKIPVLVTDDGTSLFDSRVICEVLDTLHDAAKLVPAAGADRWRVLRTQALADGIVDAAVQVFYERTHRPEELQWTPWLEGQTAKALQGLDALNVEAGSWSGIDLGQIAVGCALGWLEFRAVLGDIRPGRSLLFAWYDEFSKRPSMKATEPA